MIEATNFLAELLLDGGPAPADRFKRAVPKFNTHVHLPPNFSAFDTVQHAVDLAAREGLVVLGAANYYDYQVYQDLSVLCRERGIFPIFGTEIIGLIETLAGEGIKVNDPGNPGRVYLCGKAIVHFAEPSAEAQRLLGIIRQNDRRRMAEMVKKTEQIFSANGVPTNLNEQTVIDLIVERHHCRSGQVYLQERHLCQAFQQAFFKAVPPAERRQKLAEIFCAESKSETDDAVAVQNEIRTHLLKFGKPAFVEERFLSFAEARQLILELGGIPCYPTLADGTNPICPFEDPVEQLIENIKERRIFCAEFVPLRNNPEVLARYVTAMRKAGLVVAAGSEHNTLELHPLDIFCKGGAAVPTDVRKIFWEGACVLAAHQYFVSRGQCGFVNAQGQPNPDFKDSESRIQAFAEAGQRLIDSYAAIYGRQTASPAGV